MPTVGEGDGPCFISSHSADVILSDIRPIKLKAEALRAINVLLDEFLSKILTISASLSTDKLRASLLSLLPTSLGKEALLEAEVELRAYWDRTDCKPTLADDPTTFHLEWAYSLLRLKCEAYSTLNEQDESPAAEARINDQFGKINSHPLNSALVDPAALYLTAILESMCEHILSNVGRVAARDSSRTTATINDLFVALCEDDSIYGLFRLMNVYEQIEQMSKAPAKSRRSKSFSRSDHLSISRTSSLQHDMTSINTSGSKARHSTEGQSAAPLSASTTGSRTSLEKVKAIKMFTNGKTLGDSDSVTTHKKSDSLRSENTKQFPDDELVNPAEDAAMLREFDDLMRSTSTMKVSLTPDRLKTMEVYKQEKEQRGAIRRPGTHQSTNSEPDILPASRVNGQRTTLRHVDSIIEDEEEPIQSNVKGRVRQASIATPPTASFTGVLPTRSRSVSTSAAAVSSPLRKSTRSPSVKSPPSAFYNPVKTPDMQQSRDLRQNKLSDSGFPARTRTRGRNRDSLDLDDIMNGSDDDQEVSIPVHQSSLHSPQTPKRANPSHAVSQKTRELMDFLAEGPPEAPTPVSKNGKDLMDFLADGPPDFGNGNDNPKPKGTGRLQRMISKLNLGNGEKAKGVSDAPKTPYANQSQAPISSRPNTITHKQSAGGLSSLANRPIPPRPPRPPSPPRPLSPPASPQESSDENKSPLLPRKVHQDANIFKDVLSTKSTSEKPSPVILTQATPPMAYSTPTNVPTTPTREKHTRATPISSPRANGHTERVPVPREVLSEASPIIPVRTVSIPSPTRKPVPAVVTVTTRTPAIPENDVRDMQRLLTNATTADECRLIFEMFMARNNISREPKAPAVPYPSPSPSVIKQPKYEGSESALENSLVELFLGGATTSALIEHLPSSRSHDGTRADDLPATNDDISKNVVVPSNSSVIPGAQAIPIRV